METMLKQMDDTYFNRILDITREINENIRHYNDHQTRYRSMASQWLLGAFGAIGFVLISDPAIPFHKLWLVFAIAFLASLGVFQLWRMDMLVFNVLISTFFNIGKEMEDAYPFLPPIKNKTYENMLNHNTGQTLFYFYYIIIFAFTAICTGVLLYLIPLLWVTPYLIATSLIILIFLRLLYRRMRKRSAGSFVNAPTGAVN
jgi:hypothetical protein